MRFDALKSLRFYNAYCRFALFSSGIGNGRRSDVAYLIFGQMAVSLQVRFSGFFLCIITCSWEP
ncbi:hypothetical protein CW304_10630 [Bacillus sp. UFRGS-B20]|nr:hypothetical protein CW304_10630 [Bacillus sp. UFRGS-B20]